MSAIEDLLARLLPPGWSSHLRQATPVELAVTSPDGTTATFAVEVRRTTLGRQLDTVLGGLRTAGGLPLVAAPFLSPSLRATLADRGVSYADATGNVRLVAERPGIFVQAPGASKDPWPTDDTLRSLRGRAAGRAVRALVDFRPPYGVRDLASRAAVPLGSLSRTLDLLDREGLITRGRRGDVVDLDWEGAIRRWGQDYAFGRSNRTGCYLVDGGLATITPKLRRSTRPYAVAGTPALGRLSGAEHPGQLVLYVEDIDLASERLGLEPAGLDANVVLAEGYDRVVFERVVDHGGMSVVAPSQLAVDLLTDAGPASGPSEDLLAWMRTNPDAWRA